jgi:hypothetical protein
LQGFDLYVAGGYVAPARFYRIHPVEDAVLQPVVLREFA